MSYSFDFTVATKELAKTRVATELDKVLGAQPVHARDRAGAFAAAVAFIDLLADDDSQDVRVNVHGSVTWPYDAKDPLGTKNPMLTSAAVGVSAWNVPR